MAAPTLGNREGHLPMASAAVPARADLCHRDLVRCRFRDEGGRVTVATIEPPGVGAVREDHRRQGLRPTHEAVARDGLFAGPACGQGRARGDEPSAQGLHPVDVATWIPREVPQEDVGIAVLPGEGRPRAGQRHGTLGLSEREPVVRAVTPGAVDGLPGGLSVVAGGAEGPARRHTLHEDLVGPGFHPEDPRVAGLAGELNPVSPVGKDDGRESIALGGPIHHDIAIKRRGSGSRER